MYRYTFLQQAYLSFYVVVVVVSLVILCKNTGTSIADSTKNHQSQLILLHSRY